MIYFGSNIKFLLKQLKINQLDFSKKIGFNQSTISMWVGGKSFPDFATFLRICEVLEVDLTTMVYYDLSNNFNKSNETLLLNEPVTPYTATTEGGINNLKMELIETERQLYERIIQSKDEHIKVLERLLAEKVKS